MVKDRDLIAGMLALQADLISAGQLARATASLANDGSASLADTLLALGFINESDRAEIEAMASRRLGDSAATLAGPATPSEAISPPGDSETMVGDSSIRPSLDPADPSLQATVGPGDPSLQATMGPTDASNQPTVGGGPSPAGDLTVQGPGSSGAGHVRLTSLGETGETRYSRTHLHAKGGIGQVWLARDGDLGRDVALKELRPEQSRNSVAWSRFVEEARITGQLEHPGIVPIYELSTSADGQKPFYTMRFVRGNTLHEAIQDYHRKRAEGQAGPLDRASLLSAFIAVCNAVGYAHSRGVIHRDLKGQNVVLGDFGEVMVLDWGLAKLVDRPADPSQGPSSRRPVTLIEDESAHDATMQGQVLGTPSYMAPEQAEGRIEEIGRRTDVYGLGAILYEILAGCPPHSGASTSELLRRVREDEPAPPRESDPSTPRALEAICRKAMAKKPEDRYPSALALAEELKLWLADEPVSAYREPWPKRLARWSKRHRTAVASAAALLVTAVFALTVSAVLIGKERDEARRQRSQARQAVDDMYTKVAEQWLEDRLDPLQREMLEKALRYYENFAAVDAADPTVRQERGRAFLRLGDVLRKLGRHDEAEKAYRRSVDALAALAADDPRTPEHRSHLALANARLASELAARGKGAEQEEARALFGKASAAQAELLAEGPTTARRLARGRTERGLAELLRVTGRPSEAESSYRRAIELLEKAATEAPDNLEVLQELAASSDGLGLVLVGQGRPEDAEKADRRAIAVLEPLVARAPNLPALRDALARAYNSLGLLVRDLGSPAESEAIIRQQVALNERLAQDFPARPEYRRTLARGLKNLGILMKEANRPSRDVEPIYRRALELNESLAAEFPAVQTYRRDQASCLGHLGELLFATTRRADSEALYLKALKLFEALEAESPDVPEYRFAMAGVLNNLGVWQKAANRLKDAIATYDREDKLLEALAVGFPSNAHYRREQARCLSNMGNALWSDGRHQEADRAFGRAVGRHDELVARPPVAPADRLALATCLSNRGGNQTEGQLPGAEQSLRRSLALFEALAAEPSPSPAIRRGLAVAQNNLGDWLAASHGEAEAELAYRHAAEAFEALAAGPGAAPDDKKNLALVTGSLGGILIARGRPADARPILERAVRVERTLLDADPRNSTIRPALAEHLSALASLLADQGAYADAARAGDDWVRVASDLPGARSSAAKLMARCVPLAEVDAKVPEPRRALLAASYADRAIALLREAIVNGDPDAQRLLQDEAFAPIRNRDGFKTLRLTSLEKVTQSEE
jgi:serine/threonine protein kinase